MPSIPVPRPKGSINPQRAVNTLLQAQVQHLQQAERRLPLRYRSEIYTHAIRTEGEAAEYIREVTEAIHQAHDDAASKRSTRQKDQKTVASAKRRSRLSGSRTQRKKNSKQGRRK
jgi:hypothetical protein